MCTIMMMITSTLRYLVSKVTKTKVQLICLLLMTLRTFQHFIKLFVFDLVTRSIPEHSFLQAWWDTRARGLGGTITVTMSSGAEENLLCLRNDHYRREDIFLYEFSHGVQVSLLYCKEPFLYYVSLKLLTF